MRAKVIICQIFILDIYLTRLRLVKVPKYIGLNHVKSSFLGFADQRWPHLQAIILLSFNFQQVKKKNSKSTTILAQPIKTDYQIGEDNEIEPRLISLMCLTIVYVQKDKLLLFVFFVNQPKVFIYIMLKVHILTVRMFTDR